MNDSKIRSALDTELEEVRLSCHMKERIKKNALVKTKRQGHSHLKAAVIVIAVSVLCVTTAYAGYYINSRINVNEATLPELDSMQVVTPNKVEAAPDKYGIFKQVYDTYDNLAEALKIHLLDSPLAVDNPYMQVGITTDNKDYGMIVVNNYIIGDTSNYQLQTGERYYTYDHGSKYYSPVSLSADMVLSDEQLKIGMEKDYLGMYEFMESYVSKQGYHVDIVGNSANGNPTEGAVTKKSAIFVAGGIRYTLTGEVSTDTLKQIVDTMK